MGLTFYCVYSDELIFFLRRDIKNVMKTANNTDLIAASIR